MDNNGEAYYDIIRKKNAYLISLVLVRMGQFAGADSDYQANARICY